MFSRAEQRPRAGERLSCVEGYRKQCPLARTENVAKAWNVQDIKGESGILGLEVGFILGVMVCS